MCRIVRYFSMQMNGDEGNIDTHRSSTGVAVATTTVVVSSEWATMFNKKIALYIYYTF